MQKLISTCCWAKSDYITCAKDWQKVHRKYVEQSMIEDEEIGRTHGRIFIKAPSSLEGFLNLHLTKRWRRPRLRGDSLLQRVWQRTLLSWSRGEIAKHWHFGFCERAPRREDQERRLRMEEGSESCLGPLKRYNVLRITWYAAWVIVI